MNNYDGENANLVRGENNDVQEDNNPCRAEKGKSNEKRNIKSPLRWGERQPK